MFKLLNSEIILCMGQFWHFAQFTKGSGLTFSIGVGTICA